MTRAVVRFGDLDSSNRLGCCFFPPSTVSPTVSKVFINGRPVARVGDVLSPVYGAWVCSGSGFCFLSRTISGSSKVIVGGKPIAKIYDRTAINRKILTASTNVFAS